MNKIAKVGTDIFEKEYEKALANYKTQLKLTVKVMLEFGDKLPAVGEFFDD